MRFSVVVLIALLATASVAPVATPIAVPTGPPTLPILAPTAAPAATLPLHPKPVITFS